MRVPEEKIGVKLHDKAATEINRKLGDLPWLCNRFGVAQIYEDEGGSFPGITENDGSLSNLRIYPEKSAEAFSFHLYESAEILDPEEPYHFDLSMSLCVWGNLQEIGDRGYDYSTELILEVIEKLSESGAQVLGYEIDFDFEGWDYQFLMRPNWGVQIDYTYLITKC